MHDWRTLCSSFFSALTTAAVLLLCYHCSVQANETGDISVMAAPSRPFVVVVAAAAGSLGIGKNGALPWHLAGDMAYFKKVTSTPATPGKINAVIMGRKTWQSIPGRFRPLAGRRNIVLSRNPAARGQLLLPDDVLLAGSLAEALALLAGAPHVAEVDKVFVIGGGMVYREALGLPSAEGLTSRVAQGLCEKVLLTSVRAGDGRFDDCDVHFPVLAPERFKLVSRSPVQEEKGVEYSFDEYDRIFHADTGKSEHSAGPAVGAGIVSEGGGGGGGGITVTVDIAAEQDKEKATLSCRAQQATRDENGVLAQEDASTARSKRKADVSSACIVQESSAPTAASLAVGAKAGIGPVAEPEEERVSNDEEMQYLRLVEDILENGVLRGDRTGTGTLSKFGVQMRFSLRDNLFPLLTTKRVFWRGVAEELLWFISGCTNANVLKNRGIHIWDGNGSREFLDGLGLTEREEGDLGPVYGFQWRHFGAEYTDMHADYKGKGVDQLAECIKKIKTNPEDRRIVLSAWNPKDLEKMALPPCHMFCQFYVANGELSCQMYQRSADMGLGVPFNIASYALLTRLVAQACDLKAGELVHTIGDAHVYVNHVDALKEQLRRKPRPFPTLLVKSSNTDIDSFSYSDLEIKGYLPHKPIKMKMAV